MIAGLILCVFVVATAAAWAMGKLFFTLQGTRASGAVAAPFDHQQARGPWRLILFAVLLAVVYLVSVLFVRAFIVEPYMIPSGSMMPTLQVHDLILVNKFEYGLRMPLVHRRLTQGAPVRRGDVVVFRYPLDESVDYVKRVVGLPGDTVVYRNKSLTINAQPVPQTPLPDYYDSEQASIMKQFSETLDGTHAERIINNPSFSPDVRGMQLRVEEHCAYNEQGFICKVPPGHYFVMGDNRDNSEDSRYWGFVPDRNMIGRAFFVISSEHGHVGSLQ
jgi:signal peptidase I